MRQGRKGRLGGIRWLGRDVDHRNEVGLQWRLRAIGESVHGLIAHVPPAHEELFAGVRVFRGVDVREDDLRGFAIVVEEVLLLQGGAGRVATV